MGIASRVRAWLTRRQPLTGGAHQQPVSSPWWRHWGKRPPLTLWQIEEMEHDHKLKLANKVANGPLLQLEVEVESDRADVAEFVQRQFETLWSKGAPKFLRTRQYGHGGFEIMYCERDGHVEVSGVRDLHPRDTRPLTRDGELVGFRCRRTKEGAVDLYKPKGLWLVHGQRWGQWFGRSEFEDSYPAWFEKWQNGGMVDLRALRMVKDAWIGDQLLYPATKTIKRTDGTEVSARDIAREVIENRLSGAVITLPSSRDSNGHPEWEYKTPTSVDGATPIFEYGDNLNKEIVEGRGVPSEVIEAAEVGSGYAGRSIPMFAFLASCDEDAQEDVAQLDEQVLWPLVKINFGCERCYTIKPKSLAETLPEKMNKGQQPPGGQPGPMQPGNLGSGFRFGGGPLQMSDEAGEVPPVALRLESLLKKKRLS